MQTYFFYFIIHVSQFLLIATETREGRKTSAIRSTAHLSDNQVASHMVANLTHHINKRNLSERELFQKRSIRGPNWWVLPSTSRKKSSWFVSWKVVWELTNTLSQGGQYLGQRTFKLYIPMSGNQKPGNISILKFYTRLPWKIALFVILLFKNYLKQQRTKLFEKHLALSQATVLQ